MTDRLTDIIVGLQRLMENARIRGDDIKYGQQQEDIEHHRYLSKLLAMVDKLRREIIEQLDRFAIAGEQAPRIEQALKVSAQEQDQLREQSKPMPKFLQQGPRKVVE